MASYKKRPRPTFVSTINMDIDDFGLSPREDYRHSDGLDETTSTTLEKRRNRLCMVTLILVLIIITLLSLTGLIIAIISLVLNISKSGTVTSALTFVTATDTTTSTVQCTSTPTTSFQYSTITPPQCLNYTLDIDQTRNTDYTASIGFCDNISPFNNATPIWFRFQSPAGIVVANAPVPPYHCGAVATGWYAGQYPISDFTTATSIVCYYYSTKTCTACNLISVTNCQTFYVFLLPEPPSCNYRYCTL